MGSPMQDLPPRGRGRPRRFDPQAARIAARAQFLVRGYDRVTLNDLTAAMGINPPSFYAAFGNKALLFARIAEEYAQDWQQEMRIALNQGRTLDEALAGVLQLAAARFAPAQGSARGGCLILEAANNCSDALVAALIRKLRLGIAACIYRGAATHDPEQAAFATDWTMAILSGLSAMAREGTAAERLRAIATQAAAGPLDAARRSV